MPLPAPLRRSPDIRLLSVLCALLCALPVFASAQVPRGVFSLGSSGKAWQDAALDNPDVIGMSLRYGWSDLEPTEGAFNWSFLDSEVARAAAAGKQVLLRIGTMSGRPAWVTTAVQRAGGKFFTFNDNGNHVSPLGTECEYVEHTI